MGTGFPQPKQVEGLLVIAVVTKLSKYMFHISEAKPISDYRSQLKLSVIFLLVYCKIFCISNFWKANTNIGGYAYDDTLLIKTIKFLIEKPHPK
jgi:hypothetical protein